MMRLRNRRAGFTFIELLAIIAIVLVIALGIAVFVLWGKVSAVDGRVTTIDNKGRALTQFVASTDDPAMANMPPGTGLTTFMISVKNRLDKHMGEKVTPAGPAHTGVDDHHLDPPPPPVW